jgi:phage terminase large subunit
MPELRIPRKLKPFLAKKKRYKVAYGGRGGAKSMTFANILSMKGQLEGALIGCIREFQNSLEDSVYSLMSTQIRRLGIPGYRILSNKIDHTAGGGMRFKGLSRSIEAVKSMFGFKYFWLEEGQFISEDSLKILTPTLREAESELWISANPMSSADPFAQRFIIPYQKEIELNGFYEDDLHYIVKINYSDNPWFPAVLEAERRHDYEYLPRALYDHIWEGEFNDSVEDSIIKTEWFDAAVDAHKKLGFKPEGAVIVSHDPSDLGTDDKGLVLRHGSVILEAKSRSFGEVNEGCDWALDYAINHNADTFVWDCDGMGVALKQQVAKALQGKKIGFHMYKGSEKPWKPNQVYKPVKPITRTKQRERTNKDTFTNRRAQFYWYVRDKIYATYLAVEHGKYMNPDDMLSISSKIEDLKLLRSELCRIPRKYNATGKIQIMTKQEMRKLKIQSPNVSDSLMMSMIPVDLMTDADTPIRFKTVYA